jgi:hypothetical protein
MGGPQSRSGRGGEEKNSQINGSIILKLILKKWNVRLWNGLI